MKNKILIVVFLILIYIPSVIWTIFGSELVGESSENRALAQKPVFNVKNISEYPIQYENYYNDHLPFKNQAVKLQANIDYRIFKSTDSKKVILGKEGWLFYRSAEIEALADEKPIDDYQGINKYTESDKQIILDNLTTVDKFLEERDIEFSILICPNKENVYSEYLPEGIRKVDETSKVEDLITFLNDNTTIGVIYPYDEIMSCKDDYLLYYKYDTHWNELGGFVAAQEIREYYQGKKNEITEFEIVKSSSEPPRDLAGMLNMNGYFNDDVKYVISGYKDDVGINLIEYSDDGVSHVFNSNASDKRRVLVIRDSYGEALMPHISKDFENVIYVHRNGFDQGFIDVYQPDIVIYQVVERATDDMYDMKMIFQIE